MIQHIFNSLDKAIEERWDRAFKRFVLRFCLFLFGVACGYAWRMMQGG